MQTDHYGIVVAMFGTYVSIIYNVFHCHQEWINIHLTPVFILFMLVSVAMWIPSVANRVPWMRRKRGGLPLGLFIAISGYIVIPISHWVYLSGGLSNPLVLVSSAHTSAEQSTDHVSIAAEDEGFDNALCDRWDWIVFLCVSIPRKPERKRMF